MKKKNDKMLKVSEVAKMSGVSVPTIKHYLKEGLIPLPVKTGRTMAYYDRETVNRIIQIKKLQQEKFLSLDAIKRVIDNNELDHPDLKIVSTMAKSDKMGNALPIGEAQIESRVDYPMIKIKAMENTGILTPFSIDGEKHYDSMDVRMIGILKELESVGMDFQLGLETLEGYNTSIFDAARNAMKIFVKNSMGDIEIEQSMKIMAVESDLVDEFILLTRHKSIRMNALTGMKDLSVMRDNLMAMIFLPLKGDELPADQPENMGERLLYFMLKGSHKAIQIQVEKDPKACKPFYNAAVIMTSLMRGDYESALDDAKRLIPTPTSRHMDNSAAALAYVFSIPNLSGIASPMLYIKKACRYFKHIEAFDDPNPVLDLLAKYCCAGFYSMLPGFFENCEKALELINKIEDRFSSGKLDYSEYPTWLKRTLKYEVFPAMHLRLNRFAAMCLIKLKRNGEAEKLIDAIIDFTHPGSEFFEWARAVKQRMHKNGVADPLY